MAPFYAYVHCRPDGSVFYVGKGRGKRYRRIVGRKNPLYNRIVGKWGVENIGIGKIDCSSEEIAFDLERGIIKCLKRSGVVLSNYTDGGEGVSGMKHSDEVKEAQRQRMLEVMATQPHRKEVLRKAHVGRKASSETRLKMSASQQGRIDSDETRLKKSLAAKGVPKSEAHRKAVRLAQIGRVLSEEHRAKLSASAKADWARRKGQK